MLEDVGERPYQLDRYLTQLAPAGALRGLAGVAVGQLTDCDGEAGAEVVRRLVRRSASRPSRGSPSATRTGTWRCRSARGPRWWRRRRARRGRPRLLFDEGATARRRRAVRSPGEA